MDVPISDPIFRRFFKFDTFQVWIELFKPGKASSEPGEPSLFYRVCWVDSDWANFPGLTLNPVCLEDTVQRFQMEETNEDVMKRVFLLLFRADFLARMLQGSPINRPQSKEL